MLRESESEELQQHLDYEYQGYWCVINIYIFIHLQDVSICTYFWLCCEAVKCTITQPRAPLGQHTGLELSNFHVCLLLHIDRARPCAMTHHQDVGIWPRAPSQASNLLYKAQLLDKELSLELRNGRVNKQQNATPSPQWRGTGSVLVLPGLINLVSSVTSSPRWSFLVLRV